jgi:hypothetical protein
MKFELQPFHRNIPDDDLLSDLVAAHAELKAEGKPLTFRNYRSVGKYGPTTINDRFGSWNRALQKAGLSLQEEKNIPVEALFDNLKLVWITKGKQPAFRDMNSDASQYSASTYNARFGSWRNALKEFVAVVEHDESELNESTVQPPQAVPTINTPRDPSLALRFLVLKRDGFRCVACGRSPATDAGVELEIDHRQPWSDGGPTIAENLQTLCFNCNRGKGAT